MKRIIGVLAAVAMFAAFGIQTAGALTGAVFTTTLDCNGTNINLFSSKDAVYLDGGPHHGGSAGLDDGNYFVKVTEPNGTVLGTSASAVAQVIDGSFVSCYQLSSILQKVSDESAGYDTTSNSGGEYKVWVSATQDFQSAKTDNFKVIEDQNGGGHPGGNPNPTTGSLVVIKHVIIDNGGTAVAGDFTMNVTAVSPSSASFPGDENGTTVTVLPGDYSVSESGGPSGYAQSLSTDCSGTIAVGETKTCTVTNDDIQPKLTVTKVVVNDNGGAAVVADFPLSVGDTSVVSGEENGFNAGDYSVSELNQFGYASTFSGDCVLNGSVSLSVGEVKSCTLTNDDIAPKLTLVKHVDNTNGGLATESAWTLTASGATTTISGAGGATSDGAFQSGSYSLSESTGPIYYTSGSWSCTGDASNTGNSITLGIGQTATCNITNTFNPPTRTLGFWSTHTSYTNSIFTALGGSINVGSGLHIRTIDTQGKLYGSYFSSIPYKSDGKTKRTAIDQARMILLQQLVTAKLNCQTFGCSAATLANIATADNDYAAGTSAAQLTADSNILNTFNNSRDSVAIVGSTGNATQSTSQSLANKAFWDLP